jgi:hypothetical protein
VAFYQVRLTGVLIFVFKNTKASIHPILYQLIKQKVILKHSFQGGQRATTMPARDGAEINGKNRFCRLAALTMELSDARGDLAIGSGNLLFICGAEG